MKDDIERLKDILDFGECGGYTDVQEDRSCLDGWYSAEELRLIANAMDKLGGLK